MQKIQPWVYLFLALAFLNCGEKAKEADKHTTSAAPANLSGDIATLAGQFEADSAKTRLVLLLSPT
ncbi:MAG: hypothetical protein ALAOOOJD_03709 [bacterium]|nr:hypothetical protein [bacterium]